MEGYSIFKAIKKDEKSFPLNNIQFPNAIPIRAGRWNLIQFADFSGTSQFQNILWSEFSRQHNISTAVDIDSSAVNSFRGSPISKKFWLFRFYKKCYSQRLQKDRNNLMVTTGAKKRTCPPSLSPMWQPDQITYRTSKSSPSIPDINYRLIQLVTWTWFNFCWALLTRTASGDLENNHFCKIDWLSFAKPLGKSLLKTGRCLSSLVKSL